MSIASTFGAASSAQARPEGRLELADTWRCIFVLLQTRTVCKGTVLILGASGDAKREVLIAGGEEVDDHDYIARRQNVTGRGCDGF